MTAVGQVRPIHGIRAMSASTQQRPNLAPH